MAHQALIDGRGELTQAELETVAAQLADKLDRPHVICLHGGLGAGKSTFARAFLRAKGVTDDIPSPTFNLMQVYEGAGPKGSDIWHVDAYRLADPSEAEALGLLDAFDTALCLIEWPENLGNQLPPRCLHLHLALTDNDDLRRVALTQEAA
ncbi:MAG: tRNA (adenosine(37)-N6)-threonylcarbamoyltransferase complex ATPase subunit type 1 TsaE [Pseudomonadota bacterium]